MADIDGALKEAMTIAGAIGVALVDYSSGLTLGALGGSPTLDMQVAAAGNTDVVRAQLRTQEMIGLVDAVEDILITLGGEYHLIRMLQPRRSGDSFFLYLALDKNRANLGLARFQLRRIDADLTI
ncbi:hypothetical protein [Actinoplanes sp. NPDC051494]|uniref:hypothetical protein n=1 Tax=Actinoplanes sp. NPDC051494 TaxID=3363907 RepID=UPI0037A7552A